MCRADDDRWLRWNGEQGDCAEVLCCDAFRAEGANPGVTVPGVGVVQLGLCAGFWVDFGHWGQPRGGQSVLIAMSSFLLILALS